MTRESGLRRKVSPKTESWVALLAGEAALLARELSLEHVENRAGILDEEEVIARKELGDAR